MSYLHKLVIHPLISYGRQTFVKNNLFSSINICKGSFRRTYSLGYSDHGIDDPNIQSLRIKKRIFNISLFSTTLIIVYILKKRKDLKQKSFFQDCIKIPIDQDLYSTKIKFYRHNGFVFPDSVVQGGILEDLKNFKFRNTDIIVASFPKSGTTWIQEIVYMLCHNCQRSDSTTEVLETRFPYLEYPYPGIKTIAAKSQKRFIKTHLPLSLLPESFAESNAKLIYIVRNPRDVATSYWHFLKMASFFGFAGSFKEFADLFVSDKIPYGPYFEHLQSYFKAKENSNILIVNFEELLSDPVKIIRTIADFLQIAVNEEETLEVAKATSFASMSQNPSVNYEHWKEMGFSSKEGKFLRKGINGDWKTHFTPTILKQFQEWEASNKDK